MVTGKKTKDKASEAIVHATSLSQSEKDLFVMLENDYKAVKGDTEEQASIVHDFGDSKSERIPWLEIT